jgi:hypothetical protein
MKTSEIINEIATALSKAQGEMSGAKKAANNPFFKSKYSDLSMVVEAISQPFANNGLSFIQGAEFDENRIAVTTRIMHTSGQWVESTTYLPPTKNDAQGYGSAITYARRYGLQALAGVPSVDDDGNEAVKASTNTPVKKPTKAQLKAKWNKTIDLLWQHFNNNDTSGCYEVTSELSKAEKAELWVLLPNELKNYLTENKDPA